EALGYAAAPGPFLGNAMATIALVESEDDGEKSRWLEKVAGGEALLTIAYGEEDARWEPATFTTKAEKGTLSGTKPVVPYAPEASAFVVAAQDADGPGLWIVERGARGVTIDTLRVVDQTRRLSAVTFREAPATKVRGGAKALRRSLDAG